MKHRPPQGSPLHCGSGVGRGQEARQRCPAGQGWAALHACAVHCSVTVSKHAPGRCPPQPSRHAWKLATQEEPPLPNVAAHCFRQSAIPPGLARRHPWMQAIALVAMSTAQVRAPMPQLGAQVLAASGPSIAGEQLVMQSMRWERHALRLAIIALRQPSRQCRSPPPQPRTQAIDSMVACIAQTCSLLLQPSGHPSARAVEGSDAASAIAITIRDRRSFISVPPLARGAPDIYKANTPPVDCVKDVRQLSDVLRCLSRCRPGACGWDDRGLARSAQLEATSRHAFIMPVHGQLEPGRISSDS